METTTIFVDLGTQTGHEKGSVFWGVDPFGFLRKFPASQKLFSEKVACPSKDEDFKSDPILGGGVAHDEAIFCGFLSVSL